MKYKVSTIADFDKQLKRLSKKYPSLKSELIELVNELQVVPNRGTSLGNECYKIRLAISSKSKGKSGGARVITHFAITDDMIILLSIYDKSEQANINDKELQRLLKLTR